MVVPDMDGWLAYHLAFVACVCAALYRCGTASARLRQTSSPGCGPAKGVTVCVICPF
jgi:hypothetical protein